MLTNPTRILSRVLSVLSRVLCLPFRVGSTDENNLHGSTPQYRPQVQTPHPAQVQEEPDESGLGECSAESTVRNQTEYVLMTHIRATDVAVSLRRIPVGFYVTVQTEYGIKRTSITPASVRKDMVEWEDEIVLPSDRSSRVSLAIVASFELGPTLGNGEVLFELETTVGGLLDTYGQSKLTRFVERSEGEVNPSPLSFEVKVEQRAYGWIEHTAAADLPEPDEMRQLGELTDKGHHALMHYRENQEQRYLDESIRYFEHACDMCQPDHPSHATVLFNLATAELIHCRVGDASPDISVPVNMYRDVLRLRSLGHPDHPFSLLSLGIALEARFQNQGDEVDGTEGRSLLSQVLDVASTDSYAYYAALIALGSAAKPELVQSTEISQTIGGGLDRYRKIQRLDVILQEMFHPNSEHALFDHLGILFCIRFNHLGDLGDPEEAIPMLEVVENCISNDHPDRPSWLDNFGISLLIRYWRSGNSADLVKSIPIFEDVVQLTPDSHPDKLTRLNYLSSSLSTRYECFGDVADLERSTSLRETALQIIPDGHPDRPLWLSNLGNSLSTRYKRFGDIVDLERSISLLEDAVQLTPDGHPDRPLWLNNLGGSLSTRYKNLGDITDLQRSISLFEDAARLTLDEDPNKPVRLSNLGDALSSRYWRFGDVTDLEKSISLRGVALQLTPDGHPDRPLRLNNLGDSLSNRYQRFGDHADLEESVSMFQDAVRLTPEGHPAKPIRLNNLGGSLWTRYQRFGDVADLSKSVSLREEALQLIPDRHPSRPLWLNNLGNTLSTRYKRFEDITDLQRSISLLEDSVQFTPDGHPAKPLRLSNLGDSLLTRYSRFGDIADLERCVSLREDALQLTPDEHLDKPLWLNNLGTSLLTRYQRFGDIVDLERSLSLREDALRLMPDGHPDRPLWLNNLGNSFTTRYKRFGDITDLQRSISFLEDAVQFTPGGHPGKPLQLNNLGLSLLSRYRRQGDITDLERSISLLEETLQFTSNEQPDRLLWLNNLANSLSTRYQCFGDIADLQRSISLFENAMNLTPEGHPARPLRLNNLADSLSARHGHFGDLADLERSMSLREDALQLLPDEHPDRPFWLNNLGCSLFTRYERCGDHIDLEGSVSLYESAAQLAPDGHPNKSLWLSNLGLSLLTRYEGVGNITDLNRSILLGEDVLRLTPDEHADKPVRLHNIALSLLKRFQCSSDPSNSDLSQAILYSSRAARSRTGPSLDRFRASQLWIQCLRLLGQDPQSLLDACTVAVELLPQLAWIGLSLRDRYHQLLQAADATCDAVAIAIEVNRPELAVEWLEQGRFIMWTQLSQLRTPIDDLRTTHSEIAAQFESVSRELEHASTQGRITVDDFPNHSSTMDKSLEKEARQHHTLALSRERLLAEIRALPGFERFLLPKTIKQLSPLAYSGTVVFLNASKHRCDALVVRANSERVIHVPLSSTNYDEIADMQRRLNGLLRLNGRVVLRDNSDRGAKMKAMTPDDMFRSILPYLWETVVNPILEVLAISKSDSGNLPRIFWCPSGPFSFLPIHAAGLYGGANAGPRLSDFAVSSYIPTMSALELPSNEDPEAPSCSIQLLAVPQPSTDGQVHLSGVPDEIEVIKKLASLSSFVGFQEADGTVEDVLSKMKETDWVHFACHGTQDRSNPLDSGFLLAHGKRLKLPDIARVSRPHGGLAFLSACHTATGDDQLSEEAIHIAAGMLLAGYRGVIATMWSILDNDAPRVTEDVYKSLFRDGKVPDSREAAEALRCAIERLRDSGVSFLSWVPFIHVGL